MSVQEIAAQTFYRPPFASATNASPKDGAPFWGKGAIGTNLAMKAGPPAGLTTDNIKELS